MTEPDQLYESVTEEISTVLVGNQHVVKMLTISLLTHGHVLLEGVPGVAKTTIANLFARTTGLEYSRIQMTPDTLPADVTGTEMYDEEMGEFQIQRGPVFANLVVADEINRATAKTQSALLEAMQETSVTIEGDTLALPEPFMVIATQNPIEMEGTYELPEAQRDRFQFKLTVDLPDENEETELVNRFDDRPYLSPSDVPQVVSRDDILDARETIEDVYIDERIREYLISIVRATRERDTVEHGASPRATLAFLNAGKVNAALQGREYVVPDDVKELATSVLSHRLVLSADAELSNITAEDVIEDVLESVPSPSRASVIDSSTDSTAISSDGGDVEPSSEEP